MNRKLPIMGAWPSKGNVMAIRWYSMDRERLFLTWLSSLPKFTHLFHSLTMHGHAMQKFVKLLNQPCLVRWFLVRVA